MFKNAYSATRRYITLIEIMIVMFLISMILGVLAYNYQGALNDGRAFETRANIEKIGTILSLKIANDPSAIDELEARWKDYVRASPLVNNPDKMTRDGWGNEFKVSVEQTEDGQQRITVRSQSLDAYESGGGS